MHKGQEVPQINNCNPNTWSDSANLAHCDCYTQAVVPCATYSIESLAEIHLRRVEMSCIWLSLVII